MEIYHLEYFIEVARQKSFSKAAAIAHVSQSAISKIIKELEYNLGITLFNRTSKYVQLTDAGILFLNKAQQVVDQFHNLTMEFENEIKAEKGNILIGLPPITQATMFANLLGEFRKRYPLIDIELYEYGSKKVESAIKDGTLDIGVMCNYPESDIYESFSLANDSLKVIVHPDHPFNQFPEISLEALAEEALVMYSNDFNLHDEIIMQCNVAGFQPKIIFETSQRELMTQIVAAKLGVAFLPSKICEELNPNYITAIPLVNPQIFHRMSVIWKKGRYLSHAARLWLAFAEKYLVQNNIVND